MKRRIVTTVFGMLAIPLLGGAAYAAALSVSDNPKPQVVIPASANRSVGGKPTTHDVGDDRGVAPAPSTTVAGGDDPATHDVGDDRGVAPASSTTVAGGDDRGGRATSGQGGSSNASQSGSGKDDGVNHG